MMSPAVLSMLDRYKCTTAADFQNALKEIIQEIALLGLWRGKFFEHAAFYGGTALRILYNLDRFSEDLDFSLLRPNAQFKLTQYIKSVETELSGMGFDVTVLRKDKNLDTTIESAFIKADTQEHLIKIQVPHRIAKHFQKNTLLTIKLEVDIDPPGGFQTETKILLQPIPFSIKTYQEPDLFAGKLHAILHRNWKNRVKGRDYYDLIWYVARNIPVRMSHLEQRLRQSGGWQLDSPLQHLNLMGLLQERFSKIDFEAAKKDVLPFLRNPASIDLWSKDFFLSLLPKIKTV